jgi:hypothetical protein
MRSILVSIPLCLALAAPAGAQDDFANPEQCRGSNVVQAVRELAASGARGSLLIEAPAGSPLKVDYERHPETVRLTSTGVTLSTQFDDNVTRTWPVGISWSGGEVVVQASFSTGALRMDTRGNQAPRVVIPKDPFWVRIEGRGDVPQNVANAVRSMVSAIDTGPGGCSASAAWCAKYALKAAGNGALCALSFGTDGTACADAHDFHCSWCDCKGYDCPSC